MQALRRAETAKKNQAAPSPEAVAGGTVAAPEQDSAGTGAELPLEHKEPTADEIAAAGERERLAAEAAEAAAAAAHAPAQDARPEPVDYFGGEVPPPRAPYVPPAAQGFDPDSGAGAGSAAPAAPMPAAAPATASTPSEPAPSTVPPAYASPPAPQPEAARTAARAVFAAKQEVRSRRPLIMAQASVPSPRR